MQKIMAKNNDILGNRKDAINRVSTGENYNPDVLNCIANLSNDEVFTPPALVNQMLDTLPPELFANPETTFLDLFCKSGVFLREIVKRLDKGLAQQIPDRRQRIDHILHRQVFGIALTELTSLLSRRSVYCSKNASGKHSVAHFDTQQGNIRYTPMQHTWQGEKCRFCGAGKAVYDRGEQAETYAYQFIHTDNPKTIFNMRFDVIIGNPPYQLSDGGNKNSATPIYNLFIEHAKLLHPRYLCMIIPSRWYCGGRNLEEFRNDMLNDVHLKVLFDFFKAKDCFPGIRNGGGICYFLCDDSYSSNDVEIYNYKEGNITKSIRPKLEFGLDFFIRDNNIRNIYLKVSHLKEKKLSTVVFSQKPFGFRTNFTDYKQSGEIKLYTKKEKCGYGYVSRESISKNDSEVDKWKVVTSRSTSVPEEDNGQVLRMSQTFISEPRSVVTESYVVISVFNHKEEAENCLSYVKTKFFRLLCQPTIVSPDVSARTFYLVPLQDFSEPWTDEKLYKKYNLTQEEINFIESMIRPME